SSAGLLPTIPRFPTRRSSDLRPAAGDIVSRMERMLFGPFHSQGAGRFLDWPQSPHWRFAMIERRPFDTLGGANHGWLDAKHHFSFAQYHDPDRVHWGALRVWNDDTIQPGTGFPPHPHADMEIITYVREGAITLQDSLGNKGRTEAGDVQVMSAGTGIRHAEYNLEPGVTRIFQIWIFPDRKGEPPSWGTKPFPEAERS